MRKLLATILTLFSFHSLAELNVRVDPVSPVKEESFNVIFEISTAADDEPMISFDPVGVEVLGRSKEVSLSTSIINGRFSSTRKIKMIYEMISSTAKTAHLRDIKVELGSQTLSHPPVRINILSRKKTPRVIFLQAEISKDKVFIGEGIDVKYYLYSRVPVVQTEFKSFPKLNGFIKRFHKVVDKEEAVQYEGQVYRRSLKYSARVYPEKIGKVYIDPLRLNIQYASSSGNPFGNFGMAFNRFRSKGVSSKKLEIEVAPLPSEGVPVNFTGLVGEHEFRLVSSKQKYVVNEAIEAKLEVIGPGALEKMEAPKIYKDVALEQFDTKSEFFEVGMSSGRKVFDYTYLARADVLIPEREVGLAYFDPDEKVYKEKKINIPSLQIGGGARVKPLDEILTNNKEEGVEERQERPKTSEQLSAVAPLFKESYKGLPVAWPRLLIYALVIVVFVQLGEMSYKFFKKPSVAETVEAEIMLLKKNGLTYNGLIKVIYALASNAEDISAKTIIQESRLSQKDKDYFLEMLDILGQKDFGAKNSAKKRAIFKMSAFKALKREIENESIQISS